MLTTRQAARLLAGTLTHPDPLAAIARALGFGEPLRLGRESRLRFGVMNTSAHARVAPAHGNLRALLLDDAAPREAFTRLARALTREAPEMLWLLLARAPASGELLIAAPSSGTAPLAALVVDPARVMDSDAETLAALAACGGDSTISVEPALLVHLRWRETLGRDALTRRFYRELERCVRDLAETATGRADRRDRRAIAVLHVSRLLFLAFLEAKGWLDGDRSFLRRRFEAACGGRGAHRRLLDPLHFGTLNTPPAKRAAAARALGRVPFLNGGLFTRTPLERRHRDLRFGDEAIGAMICGLLGRYRLTARETSADWSDAAVDPEMLGRAFESLMVEEDRGASGAFYTPHPLTVGLTRHGLREVLAAGVGDDECGSGETSSSAPALARLDALRVLDPACGSGAFLVFALEEIAALRAAAGDERSVGARRRHVLTHSIFGVDVDPTAVWLCQLRLWLSVVVEEEPGDLSRLMPLPNLDRNVREGDALAGDAFGGRSVAPGERSLEPLRLRYSRATGARKRTLARALDRAERARAIEAAERELSGIAAARRELLLDARSRDLFRERRGPDVAARRALEGLRVDSRSARARLRRLREGTTAPAARGRRPALRLRHALSRSRTRRRLQPGARQSALGASARGLPRQPRVTATAILHVSLRRVARGRRGRRRWARLCLASGPRGALH